MQTYPILQLQPKKERAVLLRHPWIFSGAVKKLPKAANGDIVEVRTAEGQTLAWGFFSPESQIVCRLFAFAAGMNATGKWTGYELNLRCSLMLPSGKVKSAAHWLCAA
ncbi:MAG: hypothetical protein RMJ87_08610 [Cytophagales bacterium]|nr:hypothetical protein [Cytophagales bacterium]